MALVSWPRQTMASRVGLALHRTVLCYSSLPCLTPLLDAATTRNDTLGRTSLAPRRHFGSANPLVEPAAAALQSLQIATGLPCWATISVATVALRVALLPFTVKQRQALQAMQGAVKESSPGKEEDRARRWLDALRLWNQRTKEDKVTGPVWLFTPLFAHFPSFITMMMTIRTMAASGQHGFESGGILWFKDLTLPALDLATYTAPMGMMGAVLPGTLVLLYHHSLQQMFNSNQQGGKAVSSNLLLRTVLEWLSIPMLVIGLQLPHGIFCYWLTSSVFNIVQVPLLNSEYMQAFLAQQGLSAGSSSVKPSESIFQKARELSDSGKESSVFVLDDKAVKALGYGEVMAFARTFAKKSDWKQAHKMFLVAATKAGEVGSSDYIQALFWAGISAARLGLEGNAIELFSKVIENDSTHTEAMLALASVHKKNGSIADARRWIEEAAATDSKIKEQYLYPFDKDNPP